MTTILLADSDIGAVLHLKSMISWADYGFQIVAEAYTSDEALKFF